MSELTSEWGEGQEEQSKEVKVVATRQFLLI